MTPGETAGTATDYWGARAAEYDGFIRRVVPRYDELTERLLDAVPPAPEAVLELGCGTGNLSVVLAERFPEARFTFVDGAPEMVDSVRNRLRARYPDVAGRSRFEVGTFETFRPDAEACDLVVAKLSLHHVADLAPVYAAVGRGLRPGGVFRSVDGVRAVQPEQHRTDMERWESWWSRPGGLTEEEIASVREHVVLHDHYETLEDHFRMLRAAGLTGCDCTWRDGVFAVLSAYRP